MLHIIQEKCYEKLGRRKLFDLNSTHIVMLYINAVVSNFVSGSIIQPISRAICERL